MYIPFCSKGSYSSSILLTRDTCSLRWSEGRRDVDTFRRNFSLGWDTIIGYIFPVSVFILTPWPNIAYLFFKKTIKKYIRQVLSFKNRQYFPFCSDLQVSSSLLEVNIPWYAPFALFIYLFLFEKLFLLVAGMPLAHEFIKMKGSLRINHV